MLEKATKDELKKMGPEAVVDSRKVDGLLSVRAILPERSVIKAVFGTLAPDNGEPVVILITDEHVWIVLSLHTSRKMCSLYRMSGLSDPEADLIISAIENVLTEVAKSVHPGTETLH